MECINGAAKCLQFKISKSRFLFCFVIFPSPGSGSVLEIVSAHCIESADEWVERDEVGTGGNGGSYDGPSACLFGAGA